jgi:hypothetical protein
MFVDSLRANFEVLVNGRVLPERQRDSRHYILVQKGQEYKLKVNNYSGQQVLAVITVDGLSVMDGQPGDILSSGGYILEPNKSIEIPGWRLNNQEVAKFYFSSIDSSYAHLMGKPTNIGVIGCAFFADKSLIIPSPIESNEGFFGFVDGGEEKQSVGTEEKQSVGTEEKQSVGTGFGQVQSHHVTEVEFERNYEPFHVHVVYYLEYSHSVSDLIYKNPFPGCQPPPGWHR